MVSLVIRNADAIRELCRSHHVKSLHLGGSAADGAFDPIRSDVDFVVEFLPERRGGFNGDYFALWYALRDLLGRPVDLIEQSALTNTFVRTSLDASRISLYAAA